MGKNSQPAMGIQCEIAYTMDALSTKMGDRNPMSTHARSIFSPGCHESNDSITVTEPYPALIDQKIFDARTWK